MRCSIHARELEIYCATCTPLVPFDHGKENQIKQLKESLRAAEERWRKVKEWARGFDPLTKHANLACAVAARLAEEGYGREKARAEAAEQRADGLKQDVDRIAQAVYPHKRDRFTYSVDFVVEEIEKMQRAQAALEAIQRYAPGDATIRSIVTGVK